MSDNKPTFFEQAIAWCERVAKEAAAAAEQQKSEKKSFAETINQNALNVLTDLRVQLTRTQEKLEAERERRMEYEQRVFELSETVTKLVEDLGYANAQINGRSPHGGLRQQVESLTAELADAQRQQKADVEMIDYLRREVNALRMAEQNRDVEWREDPSNGSAYYVKAVTVGEGDTLFVTISDVMGGHETTILASDWTDWHAVEVAGA